MVGGLALDDVVAMHQVSRPAVEPSLCRFLNEDEMAEICEIFEIQVNKRKKLSTYTQANTLTQNIKTKDCGGGGHCMFRTISYGISGTPVNHGIIRGKIVDHLTTMDERILGYIEEGDIETYIKNSKMRKAGWGSEVEILAFADMADLNVFVLNRTRGNSQWEEIRKFGHIESGRNFYMSLSGMHYTYIESIEVKL